MAVALSSQGAKAFISPNLGRSCVLWISQSSASVDAVAAAEGKEDSSMGANVAVNPPETLPKEGLLDSTIDEIMPEDILEQVELEAKMVVDEMMEELEEECEVDPDSGEAKDELCVDEAKREGARQTLRRVVSRTLQAIRGSGDKQGDDETTMEEVPAGEILERGWEKRANSSSLVRNAEIWVSLSVRCKLTTRNFYTAPHQHAQKVALSCAFKALKPRKMRVKGASEEEIERAQIEAAEFIRDKLLILGPSFVKV